jgi:hypothetical protein
MAADPVSLEHRSPWSHSLDFRPFRGTEVQAEVLRDSGGIDGAAKPEC